MVERWSTSGNWNVTQRIRISATFWHQSSRMQQRRVWASCLSRKSGYFRYTLDYAKTISAKAIVVGQVNYACLKISMRFRKFLTEYEIHWNRLLRNYAIEVRTFKNRYSGQLMVYFMVRFWVMFMFLPVAAYVSTARRNLI